MNELNTILTKEPYVNQVCSRLRQLNELYPRQIVHMLLVHDYTFIVDLYATKVLNMSKDELELCKRHVSNLKLYYGKSIISESVSIMYKMKRMVA